MVKKGDIRPYEAFDNVFFILDERKPYDYHLFPCARTTEQKRVTQNRRVRFELRHDGAEA
jgi:hypothetical protein